MKKNYFFSKITTFLLCFILLTSTTVAFAASTTLMTYNGTEIRAKASVQNFKLTNQTTITIDHNQTIDAAYKARESSCSMTVKLQKKELLNIMIPEIRLKPMALADLENLIQNHQEHIDYIFLRQLFLME